jgi:pimeloyl-ACP methyl ester carboxylesterase
VILPCDDLGTGLVLVLLHAGVADRRMWTEQLKPLAGSGYRVIALDLPGFGEAPMAVEQDAPWADVLETLDWLAVERFALVGNSFGGLVAQRIAVSAPERVWALVLISSPDDALVPSAQLEAAWEAESAALELEDIEGAIQSVVEAWTLPDAPARLRLRVAAMQRRAFELQLQDGETPAGSDPLERDPGALARLEVAALILHGEREFSDFPEAARRLGSAIPGARVQAIPGAGHLAPMERPKVFREMLVDFLAEPGGLAESPT